MIVQSRCELRGVVFATTDLASAARLAIDELGVSVGEHDPYLADVRLTDENFAVGDRFVQLLTPLDDTSRVHRWLERKGGDSAYLLAIQTDDADAVVERCDGAGVRVTFQGTFNGHRVVQLHAGDLQILVELEQMTDWDTWHWPLEQAPTSVVDDLVAVDCTVDDPVRIATLLAHLLNVDHDGGTVLTLGARSVRFGRGDDRGIQAVDLATTDPTRAGDVLELCGTTVRLVR